MTQFVYDISLDESEFFAVQTALEDLIRKSEKNIADGKSTKYNSQLKPAQRVLRRLFDKTDYRDSNVSWGS